MLRLTDGQRAVLVQAFPAAANLGLGALVFGQFLRQQPFSIALAVAGIGVWLVGVAVALLLAGGKQ